MFVGAARGQRALPAAWRAALSRQEEITALALALAARGAPGACGPRSGGVDGGEEADARTSGTDPIQVAWLPDRWPGRVGLTFAPGKRSPSIYGSPWRRDLAADLDRLRDVFALDVLVPLIEDHELQSLQIGGLVTEAEARGITVLRLPIPDGGTPAAEPVRHLTAVLLACARAGRRVVVHCRGGLGRAGTLAACTLIADGVTPTEAIAAVRRVRPGAIENEAQERFVLGFVR
jgi:protein-tyrosine phosphatase